LPEASQTGRVLTGAVTLLLLAASIQAQTNAEVNAGIQFSFSLPGARSLGLGGAFLGQADDATAAYANPAGLINLSTSEISLEGRQWEFSNIFTDRGRLSGDPTGRGIDTGRGLHTGESQDDEAGASFFSFVYPAGRWGIALYRHELARFDAGFDTGGAILISSAGPGSSFDISRLRPARNTLRLNITNLGASAAYRISDSLSLGAGISYYDFEISSRTLRYDFALGGDRPDEGPGTGSGEILGPPDYRDGNVFDLQMQEGKDHQLALNAGFVWQAGGNWRLGGVYRHGPEFKFETEYRAGPRRPDGLVVRRGARFNIPDVMGLGVSWQPDEFATVNLDYVHIQYSDLTSHFTDIFPRESEGRFRIEDGGEIHLGFEYVFNWPGWLLATRFGAWHDPDHKIRYLGPDPTLQALFLGGEDETHYSAGFGYLREVFQVDVAFDFSHRVNTTSLTTVVRF
jgi:long-chain fatty acid transport protein